MKYRIFTLVLFSFLALVTVSAQSGDKKNHSGTWKFDAPYAPEGYNAGTILIGSANNKQTASMSFAGSGYSFPGENVKSKNDSISFNIYLEGQDISVKLKLESDSKMAGKAVYSEGEVPLTLTKVTPAAAK